MANRFTSSVRPDDEPRRDPTRFGHDIGRAFAEFKKEKRTKTLEDREDAEFERTGRLRELTTAAGEVEAENYLRDQGGLIPSDRTSGTMPAAAGGRTPSRFDPNLAGDIFRQERVGLARGAGRGGDGTTEAGAFVGAAPGQPAPEPATDQDVIALPGQFMGNDFAPEVVRQPRGRMIGGERFVRDPGATSEARGRAEQEEQFNRQVQELVAAGVDPQKAPAIVRQGLADEFINPEREPVTFDPDRGIFPDQETKDAYLTFLAEKRRAEEGPEEPDDLDPMKGEFPSEEARDAFLAFRRALANADEGRDPGAGPGAGRDRRISVDDAFDRLQELYSERNRFGDPVGLLIPESRLVELAERWAAGEIDERDLPSRAELEGQPVEEEEEPRPGLFQRIGEFFMGEKEQVRGDGAARAGVGRQGRDPRLEATVDSARAVVREFPGIPPSQLRTIMEEEGFESPVIDQVLQGR